MAIILNFHGYKKPWVVTENAKSSFHGNDIEIPFMMVHSHGGGHNDEPRVFPMLWPAEQCRHLPTKPSYWRTYRTHCMN